MNTCNLAHLEWAKMIKPGDLVIDATVGNGKDTLALARMLKGKGRIVGYDIQLKALESAKKLFENLTIEEQSIIELKNLSHEVFHEKNAQLIVYNLGYLPGGDKSITTTVKTTLTSVENALQALSETGMISITCYPGHAEGAKEEEMIFKWAKNLDPNFWCVTLFSWATREKAPSLVLIRRH